MILYDFVPDEALSISFLGTGCPNAERIFLEIFSGDGLLTATVRKKDVRCGPGVDIVRGQDFDLTAPCTQRVIPHIVYIPPLPCPHSLPIGPICGRAASQEFDLTEPCTQRVILSWIRDGRIWCVWLGTPCSVWCIARRGVCNQTKAEAKDRLGILFAMFSVEVIQTCLEHGIVFALENPATSRLWCFPPMTRALSDSRVKQVTFHACRFGAASKKPTMIAGTLPGLYELGKLCHGTSTKHMHVKLSGTVTATFRGKTASVPKTVLAGAYTPELCAEISRLVVQAADTQRIPRLVEAAYVGLGVFQGIQVGDHIHISSIADEL